MLVGKAPCGLKYAVKRSGNAVGYCSLTIKCGTRDEEGYHSGIAHFTEHEPRGEFVIVVAGKG